MHQSSIDNMLHCINRHLLVDPVLSSRAPLRILEVGGADINGSYRKLFAPFDCSYTSVDLAEGPNVDVVQKEPYRLDFADGSFDVVISGQMIEHCEFFWLIFKEMARVLGPEGVMFILAPSEGAIHRYPVDCYRFLPDSYAALAKYAQLQLVDSWRDEKGPFHDLVGVFRSATYQTAKRSAPAGAHPLVTGKSQLQKVYTLNDDAQKDVLKGRELNLDFLKRLHSILAPRRYLEIGVFQGASLRLAQCPATGIDPDPELEPGSPLHEKIARMSADQFFFEGFGEPLKGQIDLVYIDGMHLIENVIKDFINVESISHPGTVIVIDDVFPNTEEQASRERHTRAWAGDVWKIHQVLRDQRPDLIVLPIDTYPTGSLLVLGTDPSSTTLRDRFDVLLDLMQQWPATPDKKILDRTGAIHPQDPIIERLLRMTLNLRANQDSATSVNFIREFFQNSLPRTVVELR